MTLAFVARDSLRAQAFIDALSFAAPEIEALYFPSWDCQPYDRVSPNAAVSAERMTVLARLAKSRGAVERPRILVASVNALTQRAPPLAYLKSAAFSAAPGNSVRTEDLTHWLEFERLFARQHGARRRRLRLARRHSRPLSAWRGGADPARFLRRHARIDPRLRSGDAALDRAIALARSRADERSASDNRIRSSVSARATRPSSARPLQATISTPPSAKAVARLASNIGCRSSTTSWTRSLTMSVVRRSCSTARRGRGARANCADRRQLRGAPRGLRGRSRQGGL